MESLKTENICPRFVSATLGNIARPLREIYPPNGPADTKKGEASKFEEASISADNFEKAQVVGDDDAPLRLLADVAVARSGFAKQLFALQAAGFEELPLVSILLEPKGPGAIRSFGRVSQILVAQNLGHMLPRSFSHSGCVLGAFVDVFTALENFGFSAAERAFLGSHFGFATTVTTLGETLRQKLGPSWREKVFQRFCREVFLRNDEKTVIALQRMLKEEQTSGQSVYKNEGL